MAERLTDRPELLSPAEGGDLIHIVDVSDTTDNAAGSSVKQRIDVMLRGKVFGKNTNNPGVPATAIIFNTSSTLSPPGNQALIGDWVIYMNQSDSRLIIGIATQNCSDFPLHLDDDTRFIKFYDGTSLL